MELKLLRFHPFFMLSAVNGPASEYNRPQRLPPRPGPEPSVTSPARGSRRIRFHALTMQIDSMSTTHSRFLSALAVVWLAACPATAQDAPDFDRDIRPLLSDRCLACHGPDAEHREADLRLDDAESMTQDRGGYRVVAPRDAAGSELMNRIRTDDPDLQMPPPDSGKSLSPEEIRLLENWISSGAEFRPHWAYVPPKPHPTPAPTRFSDWPRTWIDNFLVARLEREGLSPAADADHVTLIRRVYFDLTGLPPRPEDVTEFLSDPSDQRYAAIVDRLLASDAHAERMAVYWLDLVRYADTVGYHGDQDHNISPYRDWVIDAFADNMPFDQFTRDQLAGDLVESPTIDQRIATGYNRLLQTSHEGGVQPKEYLAIYAADRVRNLSAVWMGATVGCAQCHDHKYDPYTSRDFYAMSAYFADIDEAQHFKVGTNSLPTRRPPEIKVQTRREREALARLQRQLAAADSPATREALARQIQAIEDSARVTMVTVSIAPRTVRVLPRGNWLDESGPVVQAAVPEFLRGRVPPGTSRLDLARWLTDCEHGVGLLTARVFANRFWYLMFGRGLSPSLDDFGGQGHPPDHPELLDRLALEFAQDWDVRKMLRLLVTSRAYRQSSLTPDSLRQRDPENRLFARQSSFRLPAEFVRDTELAVAGLLNRTVGGPSARPQQPAGYYRHLNFPVRKYKPDTDDRRWRRGLYVHWQRQFLHPMLKAFDAPTREECTAQRPRSNTPLAALTLLNDPSFVEAAQAFAGRILAEPGTDAERIDFAMRLATSRSADDAELEILQHALAAARADYAASPAAATKLAGRDPVTANSVKPAAATERAAWISLARVILNLDEVITRN